MAKTIIQIDSWKIEEESIKVYALKNGISADYTISISQFEAFVDHHDKRDYCSDSSDYSGQHVQDAGTMSWEAYYETGYPEQDLIEFIAIQEANQAFSDISAGLSKIIAMYPVQLKASNY